MSKLSHTGLFTILPKVFVYYCLWASSHSVPHLGYLTSFSIVKSSLSFNVHPGATSSLSLLQAEWICETQITLYQGQGLSLVPFCEGGREGAKLEALTLPSFSLFLPQSPLLTPSLSLLGLALFSVHTPSLGDLTRFMPWLPSLMESSSQTSPRTQIGIPKAPPDDPTMVCER